MWSHSTWKQHSWPDFHPAAKPSTCCFVLQRRVAGLRKKILNGGEPERNGWSRHLLLRFFLHSWSPLMGYDSNWTIVPLLAKSETRSRTPGLSDTASWKMEFQLLEIKSPQQQMEVETNEKRNRKMVEGGRRKKTEEQSEDRGGRQSKWQLHCK